MLSQTEKEAPPLSDFPKLECPFVRKIFQVDKDDWRKKGRPLGLREPEV